ncbi:MAG: cbb3-type cytochrome c oxidase subunit I [Chloroflexia bacterium]
MASITARGGLADSAPATTITGQPSHAQEASADQGLPRFFYAATAALIISAIQGVVQRLPGISDWLRDADYGGHMVTNLAQTHITIVGAGTISMTGLIYYVLPRVTKRPLFSPSLTNLSFWATVLGVFGFYLAMLSIGIYEGMMVHAGWAYDSAREWMGAWHKAPMAMTAATMGLGYWTFVTNVYVTVGQASGERKIWPEKGPSDSEFLLAKFFAVGATGLLFGTVQGVYQVLPWSLDWLHKTGDAGHMIDPMAHAHMNLVGGVSVALMGLLYYFIPRMIGKPIYSMKLGVFSFWCIFIGVFGFYFTAVGLGWIEGQMILDQGLTDVEAQAAMGIWHPLLLSTSAGIMGLGFWSFIANILLTLRQKPAPDAPADRKLVFFIGFSAIAILAGTIQGVLQTLPFIKEWLEEASPAGYFVTPLSHAQLNMVGFVMISLSTLMLFLLPRLLGRPIADPRAGRLALATMATGITASYVVYFGLGLLESIQIHNGFTAAEARASVVGEGMRYALLIGAQAILGIGYLLLFRHVSRVIGREVVRAYFRSLGGRMAGALRSSVRVHPRARADSPAVAGRRAIASALLECVFPGLGWFFSGRPFIGIMMFSLGTIYLTIVYVVVAIAGNTGPFLALVLVYLAMVLASGATCYRTYVSSLRDEAAQSA